MNSPIVATLNGQLLSSSRFRNDAILIETLFAAVTLFPSFAIWQ